MKSCFYGKERELHSMVREPQSVQFHKTRYIYFPQIVNAGVQKRITQQLTQALETGQIQVFLQPRIDLKSGKVCAAEALARWQWPDGRWSLPQHFLPALKQTGLMPLLDFYMLEQVASLQRCWMQQAAVFPISVNFAAETLLADGAVQRIERCLSHHGLKKGQIELELTEHCLMEQQQPLIPVLTELRKNGLDIAMDDFGIGSSSLSMLLQLPVDIVKLDKSFLERDITERKNYQYISQVIKLVQSAEMELVCEGVESAAQATILANLSVEQGQGWFWERPLHWRTFLQQYLQKEMEENNAREELRKNCYKLG